jgi:hypothetical protein
MNFVEKYPVELMDIIITPMTVRETVKELIELPHVTVAGVRSLAEFAGYNYGAVRTAVSRMKKNKIIIPLNNSPHTRYEISDMASFITEHYSMSEDIEGFSLAVFSLDSKRGKDKRLLIAVLKTFGFIKITNNTYITGKMDSSRLMIEIEKIGLSENIFLFDCDPVLDSAMLNRIKSLWNLDEWTKKTSEFKTDLLEFIQFKNLSEMEIYNRIFYIGPSFFNYITMGYPRLTSKYFPGRLILKEIEEIIKNVVVENSEMLIKTFFEINK